MPSLFRCWFLLVASGLFAATPRSLDQGEINGAKFAIVLPAQWNRQVLLVAPGLHPEDEPLAAAFSARDVAYKTLFTEGWIVAKTSFRRNGVVVADAIADLDALRGYIVEKYGQPERVIVEGESLGGLVALLIAERDLREPRLYQGVLAISPGLQLKENPPTLGLSLQPRIPVLFVANQGELEAAKAYIASPFSREYSVVPPALFRVSRGGHANINQRERLLALHALNEWLTRGPSTLPRPAAGSPFVDITAAPEPRASVVTMHADHHGFETRVTGFFSVGDQALLDAQPADFAAADIEPATWFKLTAGDKTYRTFYGRDLNSVKKGEWVVFPHAEGNFVLARYFGNVVATAKLSVGDAVSIQRYEKK